MRIGINTWVWVSPFTTEDFSLIPKIRQMGFDIIEVALDDPALIDAKSLRHMAEDNDLEITVCGAFGPTRDISSEDAAIRIAGQAYLEAALHFTEAVGGTIFCGPVYSAVGKTQLVSDDQKRRERDWCVSTLRRFGPLAHDAGVTIAIEPLNRFETSMVNLTEQAVDLIEEIGEPAYKVHFDTFHANIEEQSLPDAIRRAGKWLGHFHACENDRGAPGSGHIDWTGVRNALRDIAYDGPVVIESFTPGAVEIARAAAIWRPLAASQDTLATDGSRFLRGLLG